ncbi:MAG: hypothetical protein HC837_19090, partial [Chloroflexaceae bacterium]|nr:hypothetical protein [Chloroflexaceae bacterium]
VRLQAAPTMALSARGDRRGGRATAVRLQAATMRCRARPTGVLKLRFGGMQG